MPISDVRRLRADDLDAVVAIDRRLADGSRRGYFEKRLAAAQREPERHLQYGIDGDRGLVGYVLARVLAGEYGRDEACVFLEVIGVDPGSAARGFGIRLLTALEDEMRRRGIATLETSIEWHDERLVRFFARHGFTKAPRYVLACPVAQADVL